MYETGKVDLVDITGYVFVVHSGGERDDQGRVIAKPFILHIEDKNCVPIFSDVERAIQMIHETKLEDRCLAVDFLQIDTPADFIASIPYTIILDPEKTVDGKFKFKVLACQNS